MPRALSHILDYALWPIFFFGPVVATVLMLEHGVPDLVAPSVAIAASGFAAFGLERVRPEHPAHTAPDLPIWMDACHFLVGVQLGYGLAYLACLAIARWVSFPWWPLGWPLVLQIVLAVAIYEGVSYWQHRFFHRAPSFWGFHALHHSGPHLNVFRGVRFHAVDLAVPTFIGYLPLLLLGAPERMMTILNVVIGAFGVTQHANFRMRTPRWLDAVVCTPVLHRQHHARRIDESECNYGTTVMMWDRLFGTYRGATTPDGPEDVGIENDTVPRTFWKQVLEPFKGAPKNA